MARRNSAAQTVEDAPEVVETSTPEVASNGGGFDFAAVSVEVVEELPKSQREEAPNPLLDAFRSSYDAWQNGQNAGRKITVPETHVKEAKALLRRAAEKFECGLTIRTTDAGGGNVAVHYSAKEKNARQYTFDDVREWARAQGYGEDVLFPRPGREVTQLYREAHGFKVDRSKS